MATGTIDRTDTPETDHGNDHGGGMTPSYWRFGAMIATSTAVMFMLTYTNSMEWGHVQWSEERVYMSLLMGGAMAMIMLGFMWGMYRNTKANIGIMLGGFALALIALFLSRSQLFVDDEAYMNGMIPHHSIAILTSERADIDDVRVRQLADDIIKAQRKEIKEMEWLLNDIDANGEATTDAEADERPIPKFEGELNPDGEDE